MSVTKNIARNLLAYMLILAAAAGLMPVHARAGTSNFEKAVALIDEGEKNLDVRKLEQAEELLVNYCSINAPRLECDYELARLYLAQYSYWAGRDEAKATRALDQAEAYARSAITRGPQSAEEHVLLGRVYQVRLSRFPLPELSKAVLRDSPVAAEYRRALEIDSTSGDAELGLGVYYMFIPRFLGGDTDRARGHLKRASQLMPEDPTPLIWMAASYRNEGDVKEARKYIDRALALDSKNSFAKAEEARIKEAERARGVK